MTPGWRSPSLGERPREALLRYEARAREKIAQADHAEMTAAERRCELLEAAGVRAEYGKALAAIRDGLLAIPSRLAPVIAATTDVRRVQTLLDTELRLAIGNIVDGA